MHSMMPWLFLDTKWPKANILFIHVQHSPIVHLQDTFYSKNDIPKYTRSIESATNATYM